MYIPCSDILFILVKKSRQIIFGYCKSFEEACTPKKRFFFCRNNQTALMSYWLLLSWGMAELL